MGTFRTVPVMGQKKARIRYPGFTFYSRMCVYSKLFFQSRILSIISKSKEPTVKEKKGIRCNQKKCTDKTKKKKPQKRPNLADVSDVIKKSRNAKAKIKREHKSRVFADDLKNENHVHKYMLDYFKDFKQDSLVQDEDEDDASSPFKQDAEESGN